MTASSHRQQRRRTHAADHRHRRKIGCSPAAPTAPRPRQLCSASRQVVTATASMCCVFAGHLATPGHDAQPTPNNFGIGSPIAGNRRRKRKLVMPSLIVAPVSECLKPTSAGYATPLRPACALPVRHQPPRTCFAGRILIGVDKDVTACLEVVAAPLDEPDMLLGIKSRRLAGLMSCHCNRRKQSLDTSEFEPIAQFRLPFESAEQHLFVFRAGHHDTPLKRAMTVPALPAVGPRRYSRQENRVSRASGRWPGSA